MKSALEFALWTAGAVLTSEFSGYWLHRLLHSGWITFLSRNHMSHHLVLYGPLDPARPDAEYKDATHGRVALGNVGLEWIAPGVVMLGGIAGAFAVLHVPRACQITFFTVTLLWSFLVFSYLHDRMHIRGFWMERQRFLRRWFVNARTRHDIHHWTLSDRGLMNTNFGIGFYWFDRLFGTHRLYWSPFNAVGYKVAQRRFVFVTARPETTPPGPWERQSGTAGMARQAATFADLRRLSLGRPRRPG
jgi:sterol desaturase/sphingolipid hydroxylase (fatty acid hydroxylase superfamily)